MKTLFLVMFSVFYTSLGAKRYNSLDEVKVAILENYGVFITNDSTSNETCQTRLFNLTISHKNCIPKIVETYYCTGQCHTMFIPGHPSLEICKKCRPVEFNYKPIQLDCPFASRKKKRHFKYRSIQSCECGKCQFSWSVLSICDSLSNVKK